jgi:hypothetical protein
MLVPQLLSWTSLALSHSRGARVVFVAIAAANAALFPAEAATGLASNSQAWLRKPRQQSPRHCRAEAGVDYRPKMPTTRGPNGGRAQACLAAARGP